MNVLVNWAVSLVTSVVTREAVPAALSSPESVISVSRVVSVALAAVVPVPTAI